MSCDPQIIAWANTVVLTYDCSVIEGHRNEITQNKAYDTGHSQVRWPNSKHNPFPSKAIDIGPYLSGRGVPWPQVPRNWSNKAQVKQYLDDLNQWYHFAGYAKRVAMELGIKLRWGGDWDNDFYLGDNNFDDLAHWELQI